MLMKSCKYIFVGLLTVLAVSNICFAKIKLPAIVSSNMVLQRNTTITIWGWSDPGEKFFINASWLKESIQIVGSGAGEWKINIQTTDSKKPQTITLKSKASNIILNNILFGEVWLCSGQSNMTMPVSGYVGQPVFGAQQSIASAANNNLRLFNVEREASLTPRNELGKHSGWLAADAKSVAEFSAVAYYFGKQLQEILDVPVGLIHSSWGGSLIEAWMSNETLSTIRKVNLNDVDLARGNRFPTVLFNAMINPLIPYTIKGALWYQAESNASQPELYKSLFPAMVKDWRARWKTGDFPFYYVQIAPYMYDSLNRMDARNNAAFMREAQWQCLELIPNSGIAITMDIGTDFNIHPPKKKEVADRLLYNALNKTYGYKDVDYSGPVYDSMEVKNGGVYLSFRGAENGLYAFDQLSGFVIAGADKNFYPAEASIVQGRKVFAKSRQVNIPVAVRYAWRNWAEGTLFDTYLLPASSFRTDRWEDAKEGVDKIE
jgi:sialate O-acetylesterase